MCICSEAEREHGQYFLFCCCCFCDKMKNSRSDFISVKMFYWQIIKNYLGYGATAKTFVHHCTQASDVNIHVFMSQCYNRKNFLSCFKDLLVSQSSLLSDRNVSRFLVKSGCDVKLEKHL